MAPARHGHSKGSRELDSCPRKMGSLLLQPPPSLAPTQVIKDQRLLALSDLKPFVSAYFEDRA